MAAARPLAEASNLPDTQTEISVQTQWMLAVRDARDRDAFAQLFDYFAPRLKGVIMRNGSTDSQAEDIVQDVMLNNIFGLAVGAAIAHDHAL